ncbi:2-hydroxyacylsphingosine 1-beta-galactosyltransferase [Apiospora arundinis]
MARYKQPSVIVAAVVAVVAWFLIRNQQAQERWQQESDAANLVPGTNNTVLFFITGVHGLTNVHYATIQGLLEHHSHVEIHLAVPVDKESKSSSIYSGQAAKLARIAAFAQARSPAARDPAFHPLPGPSWVDALQANSDVTVAGMIQPPGYAGVARFSKQIQHSLAPWTNEEYLHIYQSARDLIEQVDPAIVVLDTMFMPAVDAARESRRLYAFITPNTLVDNFVAEQPWLGMLWKYPIMGTDFAFPVPWRDIPENALAAAKLIWSVLNVPVVKAKQRFLREQGIRDPINFYKMHRPHVPWLTQTMEGASIPVEVIPPNVTCTGPIVLSAAPAAVQDPELAACIEKYTPEQASTMAAAIRATLEKQDGVQVLWKVVNAAEREAELKQLSDLVASGRVKIAGWFKVDPVSLLETGDIMASVHHGGSNCYHEAIYTGVPQVVLPMWADLYNYAALVENIGVGVYGSRGTAPSWTVEGLTNAFLAVVDGEKAVGMREKAQNLSLKAKARPGRVVAAAEIAKWAGSGRVSDGSKK